MALSALLKRITTTDRWVIALLVLGGVASLFWSLGRPAGARVVIYTGEELAFIGPLAQDRSLELEGPLGTTQIALADGKVRVVASPCPRKICVAIGPIQRSGDLLACVPNRVVVRVEGEEANGYDLLSR